MTREEKINEDRYNVLKSTPITFENLSYDDYLIIEEVSGGLVRHFQYLWHTLSLIKADIKSELAYVDGKLTKISSAESNYNKFIELFNSFRALTIHNDEVYLVKEGLNNYWKHLDKKNRAISLSRCESVKVVDNWYGRSILTSVKVIDKFRDLPPYIE